MKIKLIILVLLPVFCFSQQNAKHDSIIERINILENDTLKAKSYLDLADLYQYSNQDSALIYYQKGLDLARRLDYKTLQARCYNHIGIIYLYQSEFDQTVKYFKKSLKLKEEINDVVGVANSYNNLGIIAKNRGNLADALEYYQNALELRKSLQTKDTLRKMVLDNIKKTGHAYMNIGNVHYQMGSYGKAIENYKISLSHYDSIDYDKGVSGCYNNIGSIFEEQENYDKAINYYNQSLEINLKLNEVRNIATIYNNIGEVFLKNSNFRKAQVSFNKSLQYFKEANDKRGISSVYSNHALVYFNEKKYSKALEMINKALKIDYQTDDRQGTAEDLNYLAEIYMEKGNYREAIEIAEKSLEISRTINTPLQSKKSCRLLAEGHEHMNEFRKSLDYYKEFKKLEDRLFNKEKHKQIEELEQKYQAEKKQQKLEKQEALLSKQEAVIAQQNTMKLVYIGGILFLGIIVVLIYSNYRQKKRANRVLTQQKEEIQAQNEELQEQNEEIQAQRNELEKQRDLANHQKDAIAVKNDEITSSIQYAKSIQAAVLPQDYFISRVLQDFFILFKPKDIVSGDFYWVNHKNNMVIAAAVDCTGHGVPGAFMSLLGMSLLNDIIDEMQDVKANEILNILRTRMIQSLHQKGLSEENRDGMDLSLIVWDKENGEIQYSGAYNPLYLVRNGKLIEYKANRMSISIQSRLDQSFNNNFIKVKRGDTLYLATDGYSDQISSSTHKKMTRGRFKNYLQQIGDMDLDDQKAELNKYFEEWRGSYEQVDDVLIVAIRV
jgi:tetratricopeptide (TPR) repeat protein